MKEVPILNRVYNVFDDGKVSESRRYEVTVKEIIPFKEIDRDTLEQWNEEVKECDFLYEKETDFFIKSWNGDDTETFVRTKDGGWFSMGYLCSGRLDIDGTLTQRLST